MSEHPPSRVVMSKNQLELILLEMREKDIYSLRRRLTYGFLIMFAVQSLSVLTIIFLAGFGKMVLSEKLILTLIAQTIGLAASIFFSIIRFIFPHK